MRLVSIISVWSDCIELLPFVIKNHLQFCDGVIVMWSIESNHGAKDKRLLEFVATHNYERVLFHQLEPLKRLKPLENETRKRNQGIEVAKKEGYTHFFLADADECYLPEEVEKDKKLFEETKINGVVCRVNVYISEPTLWCEDYNTLVPFIHKLQKDTLCGRIHDYPFAYNNKRAMIDPSRRLNIKGIVMSNTVMHHMSYVRNDVGLKVRNSSAKLINRFGMIKEMMRKAKPGYYVEMYQGELKESPNYFNICI